MVSFMAMYNYISTYSQYTEVLIGFMLCHTTLNLPPNCSNRAFFIRLPPSLVPGVRRKKARQSECIFDPFEVSDFSRRMTSRIGNLIPLPNGIQIVALSARAMKCKHIVRKWQRRRRRIAVFFLLLFETEYCYNALWKITHFDFFQSEKD